MMMLQNIYCSQLLTNIQWDTDS